MQKNKLTIKITFLIIVLLIASLLSGCIKTVEYNDLQIQIDTLNEDIANLKLENSQKEIENAESTVELELKIQTKDDLAKETGKLEEEYEKLSEEHAEYMYKGLGIIHDDLPTYFYVIMENRDDFDGDWFDTSAYYSEGTHGETMVFYSQLYTKDGNNYGSMRITLSKDELNVTQVAFLYDTNYSTSSRDKMVEKYVQLAAEGVIMALEDIKEYDDSVAKRAKEFIESKSLKGTDIIYRELDDDGLLFYIIELGE